MEILGLLELKETEHSYYCEDNNFYYNNNLSYQGWKEFKEDWGINNLDIDMNYIFRFDIVKTSRNRYDLKLYFMHQRKGKFQPLVITNIKKEDMEEITEFLKEHYNYGLELWKEFQ